jgi:hypothetical protein
MLQIRHHVPGRVRFRIAPRESVSGFSRSAGRHRSRADDLVSILRRQPGVLRVRLNPACASLVLHYDPARTTPEGLRQAALAQLAEPRPRGLADLLRRWRLLPVARVSRPGSMGCRMCRLQMRLARGLMRSTLRCWWQAWREPGRRRARRSGAAVTQRLSGTE